MCTLGWGGGGEGQGCVKIKDWCPFFLPQYQCYDTDVYRAEGRERQYMSCEL